jgi:hypothetical protein
MISSSATSGDHHHLLCSVSKCLGWKVNCGSLPYGYHIFFSLLTAPRAHKKKKKIHAPPPPNTNTYLGFGRFRGVSAARVPIPGRPITAAPPWSLALAGSRDHFGC